MNRRAFTILETTIALAILVAGIAILTSGYGSAVFMTHDADNIRMASSKVMLPPNYICEPSQTSVDAL